MGVVTIKGEGPVLVVNLGRPIVTNGNLLHSSIREPIELLFGVVSGVGTGTGVLDGGRHAARGRGFGRFRGVFSLICLNGALLSRNVLDSCVKS